MPPTPEQLHAVAASQEVRLANLELRLAEHLRDYEEFKKVLAQASIELRELEDWRLEVQVYLRQLRWVVVLAAGALVTGIINLLLNLELHVN